MKAAVLISGAGTTLENFLALVERGELPLEVVCVVSSRRGAYGLMRAKRHNIPTYVRPRRKYPDVAAYTAAVFEPVRKHGAELVLLAGFMVQINVPADFRNRIMNVHPALIPAFCGKGLYGHLVHEAAIAAGVKVAGCTVHFVDDEYDHGPIILQEPVRVLDDDTPETLAERVQAAERRIYPQAVRAFIEGRLRVVGNKVYMVGQPAG